MINSETFELIKAEYNEALKEYKAALRFENNCDIDFIEVAILNTNACKEKCSAKLLAVREAERALNG